MKLQTLYIYKDQTDKKLQNTDTIYIIISLIKKLILKVHILYLTIIFMIFTVYLRTVIMVFSLEIIFGYFYQTKKIIWKKEILTSLKN